MPTPHLKRLASIVAGVIVLCAASAWLYGQLTHISVDDARVAADVIAVSSRVPGRITAVNTVAGDAVKAGAVLITIDNRETTLAIEELDARISGIVSRKAEIQARITMVDQQTASQSGEKQARIAAARAEAASALAQRDLATADFARIDQLLKSNAVSRQEWDRVRTAVQAANQRVLSTEADVETAKAQLAQAEAGRRELVVLEGQAASLLPEARQLTAQRDRALMDLHDRTISMPFNGTVDQVFVHAGEYVTPGQRLLMLHDPARLRIDANVKETDVRYFQPGLHVEVTADAYPDRSFEGIVDRISGAATSEFALLPNPNPSGNFTKISQRIPIRITVPQPSEWLKPGMMVEVLAKK